MNKGASLFRVRRIMVVMTLLMGAITVATSVWCQSGVLDGVALFISMIATIFCGIAFIVVNIFEYYTEGYVCDTCGHDYVPTDSRSTGIVHPFKSKRLLRCTKCGKSMWHSRK